MAISCFSYYLVLREHQKNPYWIRPKAKDVLQHLVSCFVLSPQWPYGWLWDAHKAGKAYLLPLFLCRKYSEACYYWAWRQSLWLVFIDRSKLIPINKSCSNQFCRLTTCCMKKYGTCFVHPAFSTNQYHWMNPLILDKEKLITVYFQHPADFSQCCPPHPITIFLNAPNIVTFPNKVGFPVSWSFWLLGSVTFPALLLPVDLWWPELCTVFHIRQHHRFV